MSSEKSTIVENPEFIERFIEVCESNKPTKIKRLLNISDQAARNYLAGRLPTADILITIAKQTPYSLHWLLTGCGAKFVVDPGDGEEKATPEFTDKQVESIEKICVRVMAEHQQETQPKIVVLPHDKLKSEKAREAKTDIVKEEQKGSK